MKQLAVAALLLLLVTIPVPAQDAQTAAPGYGMYYIWIVRHLAGNRYRGFHYTPEHEWVLDAKQQGWRPEGVPGL